MKNTYLFLAILLAMLASFSCKDASTTPTEQADPIAAIKNVPFWLRNLSLGDSTVNLENYARFRFLVGDTRLIGNDGCNYYYGVYSYLNGFITFDSIMWTLVGCPSINPQLCPDLLLHQWEISVSDTLLMIKRSDTSFVFSSPYIKPLSGLSITGKLWHYIGSNDTSYQSRRTSNLSPVLRFMSNRKLGGCWYYNGLTTGSGFNDVEGVVAVAEKELICFLDYSIFPPSTSGVPYSGYDEAYLRNILRSTQYSNTDTTLQLINQSAGLYYDFVLLK
jgi:heat shock protein HslJ